MDSFAPALHPTCMPNCESSACHSLRLRACVCLGVVMFIAALAPARALQTAVPQGNQSASQAVAESAKRGSRKMR